MRQNGWLRRMFQSYQRSPVATPETQAQPNLQNRDDNQTTGSANWKTRVDSAKFILLFLVLIGICAAVQFHGLRNGVVPLFQNQTVPTSLLNTGSLGRILRRIGRVQRIPNDGRLWPNSTQDQENATGMNRKHKPGSFVFAAASGPDSLGKLLITEVQPSNAGELLDRDGHCPDWIELRNPTSKSFDASGWYLTDDPKSLDKWKFPELVVQPGERFIVFASGKNSHDTGELHTNFRLAKAGDYVALVRPDKRTVVQELRFDVARDHLGVSFGPTVNASEPLLSPTPGAKNSMAAKGFVTEVLFSHDSCLFESSILVTLSCENADALIRYTTDGNLPSESTGHLYRGPLEINTTTVIRARAMAPQQKSSRPVTRTYLNLNRLVQQSREPTGFPKLWHETIADYEMDPRITTGYENEVKTALKSLPIVSVVTEPEELFGAEGIYSNTWQRGFEWEIPATVELLDFGDKQGFRADCGIRLAGNESRRADWKKHSFRLNFRGRYGLPALDYPLFEKPGNDQFATLLLRSTDDSWLSHNKRVRENAQYFRDQWTRDTELAMGRLSARGRFVHVCLNGLYWGVYNLMERPDDEFLAHQLGGQPKDYITLRTRIRRLDSDVAGEQVWNEIFKLAGQDLRVSRNFEAIAKRLDLVDFIDYCLIHMYAGGEDWALARENNMRAYCKRDADSRLRFLSWDADSTFASGWNNDSVDYVFHISDSDATEIFQFVFNRLIQNSSFRQLFTSRIQRWCVDGAVLSSSAARKRYANLASEIEPALMAEAARWGDVHSAEPYTPRGHWEDQKQRILREWFPNRSEVVLKELRQYWEE